MAMTAAVIGLGALIGTSGIVAAKKTSAAKRCHLARGEDIVARFPTGVVSNHTRSFNPTHLSWTDQTETEWRACLNGVGRRWFIGRTTEEPNGGNTGRFAAFQIAGRYVTFVGRWGSRYGLAASRVYQYNLRTGHRTALAEYGPANEIVDEPVGSGSPSLVANAGGDAVWLLDVEKLESLGSVSVVVHDRMGTRTLVSYPVQLVNGAWASPVTGLAITQSKVSWRHGDEEQSAPVFST